MCCIDSVKLNDMDIMTRFDTWKFIQDYIFKRKCTTADKLYFGYIYLNVQES